MVQLVPLANTEFPTVAWFRWIMARERLAESSGIVTRLVICPISLFSVVRQTVGRGDGLAEGVVGVPKTQR
jgi:hypothetical protein